MGSGGAGESQARSPPACKARTVLTKSAFPALPNANFHSSSVAGHERTSARARSSASNLLTKTFEGPRLEEVDDPTAAGTGSPAATVGRWIVEQLFLAREGGPLTPGRSCSSYFRFLFIFLWVAFHLLL